jgi:transposase-like protein
MEGKLNRKLQGTIEVDETCIEGMSRRKGKLTGFENKISVVSLVQRNGKVRSFVVDTVSSLTLKKVLLENVSKASNLKTDEWRGYKKVGIEFASHQVVNHKKLEYARSDVITNTVEGYFGLLKHSVNDIFHHNNKKHLQRYLAEFDFRYNLRKLKDEKITPIAIKGFEGKRLLYSD